MGKRVRSGAFLMLLLAVFLGMFAVFGPGVYNDSDQYLKMHIHREPLYPLFLAALRTVFPNGWLIAMGVLQNVFAAVSVCPYSPCFLWNAVKYLRKKRKGNAGRRRFVPFFLHFWFLWPGRR